MIKIKQRIPNFCSGVNPQTAEAETLEEILQTPWIQNYTKQDFHQFTRSRDGKLLMLENEDGTHWWVVGTVAAGNVMELPQTRMINKE